MEPGSIVILNLISPAEKYWGVLESLALHGVTLRCLKIESFDDWTRSIVSEETPSLGLARIFFPMTRVERMFLDERIGEVDSMCEFFEQRVGKSVQEYLEETGVFATAAGVGGGVN